MSSPDLGLWRTLCEARRGLRDFGPRLEMTDSDPVPGTRVVVGIMLDRTTPELRWVVCRHRQLLSETINAHQPAA